MDMDRMLHQVLSQLETPIEIRGKGERGKEIGERGAGGRQLLNILLYKIYFLCLLKHTNINIDA